MAIAGVLVTTLNREVESEVVDRLNSMEGVKVQEIGAKGIAAVLEAETTERLKELSEGIRDWDEVADFQLTYLNWDGFAGDN